MDTDLDHQIGAWRAHIDKHREVSPPDADELEDHLRGRVADLVASGLAPDEAFLVAVKRMGGLDVLTREFAREHSERLWKQLVLPGDDPESPATVRTDVTTMLVFAVMAGLSIKLPALAGIENLDEYFGFYARNLSLFALVPLAGYLCWRREVPIATLGALVTLFGVGAIAANLFPPDNDGPATVLTAVHLPIALWLVVGVAYVGGDWHSVKLRMDFIRFTGEWVIYYVLIALGGGVLSGLVLGTFSAAGVDAFPLVGEWVLPCGGLAAVVVAAWLVEAKKSVIENMAPVLTMLFTPLFVIALLAVLPALLWSGLDVDRDMLIVFDLLLVVVLGLFVYGISARPPETSPDVNDRLRWVLALVALAVDLVVLVALTSRTTEFGFSANKTAALGENLILLTNLAGSAWLLLGLLRGRVRFGAVESWQTGYLAVYAAWAWMVVLAFPFLFDLS